MKYQNDSDFVPTSAALFQDRGKLNDGHKEETTALSFTLGTNSAKKQI